MAIKDGFSHLKGKISRQRIWQLRNIAKGVCEKCGAKLATKNHCAKHALQQRMASRRKHGFKAWKAGGVGRPPTF